MLRIRRRCVQGKTPVILDPNENRPLRCLFHAGFQSVTTAAKRARKPLGAVACGHPVTAAAAAETLRDGGNAFDAVIAAQCAACVCEPVLASLAGGGFLVAQRAGNDPMVYDFFVQTPLAKQPPEALDFYGVEVDFGGVMQEFHIGVGAAATPGFVRGLFDIHGDLCRLPVQRLMQPAIDAARTGVRVTPLQAYILKTVAPICCANEDVRAVYAGGGQQPLGEGDILRQPELADSLEALGAEGADLFYQGGLAASLIELCRAGGQIRPEDLVRYRTIRRKPLSLRYRGAKVATNPLPSTGGMLAALTLGLLEDTEPADETQRVANLAHAMRLTNRARLESGTAAPFDPELVARYRRAMRGRARSRRGTTHISVADSEGNLAAMTVSNGEGCGRLLPGTGIALNNMLGEEDINPDGFHAWTPGTRLASMMAPTLVETPGQRFALGSGGSNRIRSAIVQSIDHLVRAGRSPEAAVGAPRLHVEGERLSLEGGFSPETVAVLEDAFEDIEHWGRANLFFGGVHVAGERDGRFVAVGDPRRGGCGTIV